MNRDHVPYHLQEAEEELGRTIADLREDQLSAEAFQVQMQHLHRHLNIAWNVRAERPSVVAAMSDEDFQRWRLFPGDLFFGKAWFRRLDAGPGARLWLRVIERGSGRAERPPVRGRDGEPAEGQGVRLRIAVSLLITSSPTPGDPGAMCV